MSTPHPNDAPQERPGPQPTIVEPVETEGFPWTGLTLLLVVLGLIAFMAVPAGPVSPQARAAERLELSSRQALGEMRAAIRDYYLDHRTFPGRNPRPSTRNGAGMRWFERQLTLHTDDAGNPAASATREHTFGPYLPHGLLANPINELSTVLFAESSKSFQPDDSTGWVYFHAEGVLRLNSSSPMRGSSLRFFDL